MSNNSSYSSAAKGILNNLDSKISNLNNANKNNAVISPNSMRQFELSLSQVSGVIKKTQNRFANDYKRLRTTAAETGTPINLKNFPISKYNAEIARLEGVIKNRSNAAARNAKAIANKELTNKKAQQKTTIIRLKKSLTDLRRKVQGNNRG